MRSLPNPTRPPMAPRQLTMTLDSVKTRGMSPSERRLVLARLTNLLLQAAGIPAGERADDGR